MDREHGGAAHRHGRGDEGPLVTRLWGNVASPATGLLARLLGGTAHDDRPFWISLDGGLGSVMQGIAAGEDVRDALASRAR